jgi:hypothetical protein
MKDLPPILARDYFWNVVWPHVQLFGTAILLLMVLIGLL